MIILRNKLFSEEDDLRKQIREDKKALLEKGRKKKDAALNALPYITTTSGAIVGGGLGFAAYQEALNKYAVKALKDLDMVRNVNTAISINESEKKRKRALDLLDPNSKEVKKIKKVLKIGTSKPVIYGVPLVSAGIGAIIGKKLGDKKVQDIKELINKGKGKKKDDNIKK